jgi:hypothetical protein
MIATNIARYRIETVFLKEYLVLDSLILLTTISSKKLSGIRDRELSAQERYKSPFANRVTGISDEQARIGQK